MFHQLLTLSFLGASAICAAPVGASRSTSEPTKVTVMVPLTVTAQTPSLTILANLQARQWEWTPSAPAWTQPAWSDPTAVTGSAEPAWTPSRSLAYTKVSTSKPTSISDWIDTHRPDPSVTSTGWITGLCVLAGIAGLGLIWYIYTLIRMQTHKHAQKSLSRSASDVEGSAGLHGNSQTPASDTPPGPLAIPIAGSNREDVSTTRQSQDLSEMPHLAEPLDGLTQDPRRLSPVYQNNIPPQETHWPQGETTQYTTWTRGTGHCES